MSEPEIESDQAAYRVRFHDGAAFVPIEDHERAQRDIHRLRAVIADATKGDLLSGYGTYMMGFFDGGQWVRLEDYKQLEQTCRRLKYLAMPDASPPKSERRRARRLRQMLAVRIAPWLSGPGP